MCVCLCVHSVCTKSLLLGVRGVGVCPWAQVLAAPRHSWLGCWGVCVFVYALRLYPATPGWVVRLGCVCLGSGFGCPPPLLAGVFGCVCARVCSACLPPLLAGLWGVGVCAWDRVFGGAPPLLAWVLGLCACLCARSACTPPLLAGFCCVGVCVWARILAAPRLFWSGCWGVRVFVRAPLVPRHSWLGCAVWLCVRGLGFRLRPATPGWGVRVFVCLWVRSALTPPLLAGVCGVGVCAWTRVLAAPATPGWGVGVCVCLCARSACTPPLLAGVCGVGVGAWARVSAAPRHVWRGCPGVCVPVRALRLYPASPGGGSWCVGLVLPGTCSCAVVRCVLCALPGFAAPGGHCCLAPVRVPWLWPAACLSCVPGGPAWCAAPRPVRSLSVLWWAFPTPWCLSQSALLGGCAGHAEVGREPGSLCLPLTPAEAGALGSLRVVPVRGPAMGLSPAGPSGVGLGLCALRWFACVGPVTDASGFPYRPSSDGGLSRCTGAVSYARHKNGKNDERTRKMDLKSPQMYY